MLTIGFAGTAKNTGKTTAALRLLSQCAQRGLPLALTSIGYDGETLDNVTGLPKPRYFAHPGTVVATAEHCLAAGTAPYREILATGIHTVLGKIKLVEITGPGSVVLAGPNRGRDIAALLDLFRARGSAVAILDGALNRLVPLIFSDGLVLSTGAAFDENIPHIAAHAAAVVALFRLPVEPDVPFPTCIEIQLQGGSRILLPGRPLLSHEAVNALLAALPHAASRLSLPGACHPRFFEILLERGRSALAGCRFVFASPFHLLASGDPLHWQRLLSGLANSGQSAACCQTVPLRLITVNPFFPRYLSSGSYQAEWIDKDDLRRQVQARVNPVPVENVRDPDCPNLLSLFSGQFS